MSRKPTATSRVPQSRLGRLARLGLVAGELAVGGALQGLRRIGGVDTSNARFSVATARRLADRLAHLRGAAMKLGQLISLEGEGLLPPELAEALESLRSQAAAMPPEQLRRVLGHAYGSGWERRFEVFDEAPMAAASIGQVHRATTRDGRDIALKVQYPGVSKSIASDVDNVATLLRLAQLLPLGINVDAIAREAKRQLTQEADYIAEARFLEQYSGLVADEPDVVVPRVHWDYTTARVMAMDYMEGVPLDSLGQDTPQKVRDALGALLQRLMFRELFEFRVMQTDPNLRTICISRRRADWCCSISAPHSSSQSCSPSVFGRSPAPSSTAIAARSGAMRRRSAISRRTRTKMRSTRRSKSCGSSVSHCMRGVSTTRGFRSAAPRARSRHRPRVQARAAAHATDRHDVPASQAGGRLSAARTARCPRSDQPDRSSLPRGPRRAAVRRGVIGVSPGST